MSRRRRPRPSSSTTEPLTEMQRLFYGDRSHALLIVLQGIDGAGKDGTCWHVISAMDPQGVKVQGFKQPTPEEATRFPMAGASACARQGEVAVFNRSHYEDVLVERVHKLVPKPVWKARYDFINEWEKLCRGEQHDHPEVLPLHLEGRATRPLQGAARRSRTAVEDQRQRLQRARLWGDYIDAFEDALSKCSKKHAPWYVIPVEPQMVPQSRGVPDHRRRDGGYEAQLPKPTVDLKKIRKLYHQAAGDSRAGRAGKVK